jgi:hypothetical protein
MRWLTASSVFSDPLLESFHRPTRGPGRIRQFEVLFGSEKTTQLCQIRGADPLRGPY